MALRDRDEADRSPCTDRGAPSARLGTHRRRPRHRGVHRPQRRTGQRTGPRQGPGRRAPTEHRRTDYAYVSRLPADPEQMYRHLYRGLGNDALADYEAWTNVGELLQATYVPAPQRAALFRAAASIRGAAPVGDAVDAAGRTGTAVAMTGPGGLREEYIFDRKTYRYLGKRSVVVNAEKAQAPVGSVLSSTALLKVTVADRAPACPERDRCLD
ncbi:CU044_5270 family protein [Actinomadura sp. 21ATH]|uniref:CU044_5270 family protein n=1 Tax=Actinomadura sp. 21ATH TaxID=1735444 RepID=UPI0035BEC200